MRKHLCVAATSLVLLTSAACTAQSPADNATIKGTLLESGGPAPGTPRPVGHGTITAYRGSTIVATATVGLDGTFSMAVPAGELTVAGVMSGNYPCTEPPLTLQSGATATVQVVCNID